MRFRAELRNGDCLLSVLTCMEKLGQFVMIKLNPSSVAFGMTSEQTKGEEVFAVLSQNEMFEGYRIESKNENCIMLYANVQNLVHTLSFNGGFSSIHIRLTKKANSRAYLTFEMSNANKKITQDVPVTVRPAEDFVKMNEPALGSPTVRVRMPPLKNLQTVVEHMKTLSKDISVRMTAGGECCFHVHNGLVSVRTFYKGLGLDTEKTVEASQLACQATMSIKKLHNVLYAKNIDFAYALGCIVDTHAFVLYIKLLENKGTLTYYVPLIQEEDEHEE